MIFLFFRMCIIRQIFVPQITGRGVWTYVRMRRLCSLCQRKSYMGMHICKHLLFISEADTEFNLNRSLKWSKPTISFSESNTGHEKCKLSNESITAAHKYTMFISLINSHYSSKYYLTWG